MQGQKTGGREAGTPNKKTLELEALIQEKFPNFNPLIAIIEIAQSELIPTELSLQCYKEVASYLYPKRKALID